MLVFISIYNLDFIAVFITVFVCVSAPSVIFTAKLSL